MYRDTVEIDLYVYIFTCTMCNINIYICIFAIYSNVCSKEPLCYHFSKITTVDMYPVWNHCAGQS